MICSLGISNFLEEISSLSHLIAFLYFFALTTEEGFLISPCYSLELCIQMGMSFFFSFAFLYLFFSQLFVSKQFFWFLITIPKCVCGAVAPHTTNKQISGHQQGVQEFS